MPTFARCRRRVPHWFAVLLAACSLLVLKASSASAQDMTETVPTICPTPFTPFTGLTHHAGHAWRISWIATPGQMGSAAYRAQNFTVKSEDGKATWTSPGVFATCTLTYHYGTFGNILYSVFNWHIVEYTGRVTENTDYDNGGGCTDYRLIVDDSPDPCEGRTDGGSDGDAGATGGGSPGGGGWGYLCTDMELAPGCYDVYVDDVYDSTICC